MKKAKEKHGKDRISELPDPILDHILSFLPTKQVVQTCILSTKWKSVWRSIPSLDFNMTSFPNFKSYNNFVMSVLSGHEPDIYKFTYTLCHAFRAAYMDAPDPDLPHINSIITSVIKHHVRDLELNITRKGYGASFELTRRIFTCTSLRELKLDLQNIHINLPDSIRLPMLQILHLKGILFHSGRVGALISNCPVLETLVLACNFSRAKGLTICAYQLKHLSLYNHLPSTTITTPNLVSLKYFASSAEVRFTDNLVYLANADFDFCFVPSMVPLLSMVQNVQSLTLSVEFNLSYDAALTLDKNILECIQIPFLNLKLLKVQTLYYEAYALMIKTLLKYSPNIESLILENREKRTSQIPNQKYFQEEKLLSKFMLPHLKSVCMKYFKGIDTEVEIVKFLLEKATALEKLIIKVEASEFTRLAIRGITEDIVLDPRASTSVLIKFI